MDTMSKICGLTGRQNDRCHGHDSDVRDLPKRKVQHASLDIVCSGRWPPEKGDECIIAGGR